MSEIIFFDLKNKQDISTSYQSDIISAYKFFFRNAFNIYVDIKKLPYPKKPKKLPKVLSVQEIERFFKVVVDIKYRTIFLLIYSAGLRVSEAARLKLEHIDSERGLLTLINAKG